MKAIILSAGEGTRMRPLTLTKPKTMLPVAGKPIIQYNIEALRDCGVKDILLIVGYKEEIVRNYFKDGSHLGVNISYATQSKLEGTADAIGYGKDFIEDSLITLNGDIILDVDILSEIIEDYEKSKPDTLMVLTEVEDPSAFGVVELDGDNIINIVEKPKKEEAPSNLINTGIYIFNKDIFDKIAKTEVSPRGEYEITDSLSLQIADGKVVKGHKTTKEWMDIGKPWELIEINEELLNNIEGGSNCNIAAGTNIANLRFDNKTVKTTIKNKKTDTGRRKLGAIVGDSVKTGINSSLSPGVKIGVRATIGSGVLLYEDLESDMRVLVKQEHIYQNKKETGQISLEEAEDNKEE